MRLLLDTQALILAGRDELPQGAKEAFSSSSNSIYFSLASLWEIGIKAALGKLEFRKSLTKYRDLLVEELGLHLLSIEVSHIEKAVHLPRHHRDPFDRLLIGQALTESLGVIGNDAVFEKYGCERIWK